jgi:hypothetical protein
MKTAPTFARPRRPFGDPVAAPSPNATFIPPPNTNLVNLNLPLRAVLPTVDTDAAHDGQIVFHAVGDTGGIHGTVAQDAIAAQMEQQIQTAPANAKPRFFYHLGDVVYFNGQSKSYATQFYEPYQYYNAPIFAVPGNHDGDTFVRPGDLPDSEPSLYGFMQNFCSPHAQNLDPYRKTMTQPYVYWTLEAPFVTIVGLYSNVDGLLDGHGAYEQQRWLEQQLTAAAPDKFLLISVHHPPYSLDANHGGSSDIGDAIDQAAAVSKRWPDAILSGHVHNYQRFTRMVGKKSIPYVVAGSGGYANTPLSLHQLQQNPGSPAIKAPFATTVPGVTLQCYDQADPGFLRFTIDAHNLVGEYFSVPFRGTPPPKPVDSFKVAR